VIQIIHIHHIILFTINLSSDYGHSFMQSKWIAH